MQPDYELSDDQAFAKPTALASGLYQDQVVIVTGGGSGIGRAIAWLAARLGAQVLIYGRRVEKVERVTQAIRARGLRCEPGVLDIRDRGAVDAIFADVAARWGGVDVLINNAGGHFPSRAIDISEKGWKAVIENNLTGTFNMMQAAARQWRDAQRGGTIVNITLQPRGIHHLSHSQASRAAVVEFTQCAAVEWAEYGIRANCVAPGSVITEIWGEKERAVYGEGNPTRRAGTVWEIAELTLFLGSSAAAYINGQSINIDGGLSLWGETWPLGKPKNLRDASRAWETEAGLLDDRWRHKGK